MMRPTHHPRGDRAADRIGGRTGERGAATVELVAIAVPILLLALVTVGAVGRLVATQLALGGITRDAARTAVTATTASHAVELARQRGQAAAASYHLDPGRLTVSVEHGGFVRGGTVTVTARYQLRLPGPGLTATLTDAHTELIDPYASR